jgi:hypothetical protein
MTVGGVSGRRSQPALACAYIRSVPDSSISEMPLAERIGLTDPASVVRLGTCRRWGDSGPGETFAGCGSCGVLETATTARKARGPKRLGSQQRLGARPLPSPRVANQSRLAYVFKPSSACKCPNRSGSMARRSSKSWRRAPDQRQ